MTKGMVDRPAVIQECNQVSFVFIASGSINNVLVRLYAQSQQLIERRQLAFCQAVIEEGRKRGARVLAGECCELGR